MESVKIMIEDGKNVISERCWAEQKWSKSNNIIVNDVIRTKLEGSHVYMDANMLIPK